MRANMRAMRALWLAVAAAQQVPEYVDAGGQPVIYHVQNIVMPWSYGSRRFSMRLELGEKGGVGCRTANFCPIAHSTTSPCWNFGRGVIEHFRGPSPPVATVQASSEGIQSGATYNSDDDKVWSNALASPGGPFDADSYPLCADSTYVDSANPGALAITNGMFDWGLLTNPAAYSSFQSCLQSINCGTAVVGSSGDPHLNLFGGGRADFRGRNNTFFALASLPGYSFSARTTDTDFLLPRPMLVHGSFFTSAAWVARGASAAEYEVFTRADHVGFRGLNHSDGALLHQSKGVWKEWWHDGVRVYMKQATLYVRANGFEVNVTRKPIYNPVDTFSPWRYDIRMRPLPGEFEAEHGRVSKTCFPHGLVAQGWDGSNTAVDGRTDSYVYNASHPVVTTSAQAEGAIEGEARDYQLADATATDFKFSRFQKSDDCLCAPRNGTRLTGTKHRAFSDAPVGASEDSMEAQHKL